jgi:hypothetical protein
MPPRFPWRRRPGVPSSSDSRRPPG